jgi:quinol monooxygenase YgiN
MGTLKYLLIIHEVEDYRKWKVIFDKSVVMRREAGELSFQVFKYRNEPNKIVHIGEWTSHEQAQQFFDSPELVKIRADAGVREPQFVYLEELDSDVQNNNRL